VCKLGVSIECLEIGSSVVRVIFTGVIESDDEYDSEMDDFIDDSEDTNEYSKYISEIFKYDRSK